MLLLLSVAIASPLHVSAVVDGGDTYWLLDVEAETITASTDGNRSEAGRMLGLADYVAHDGSLYALRGRVLFRLENGAWKEQHRVDSADIFEPPMVWRDGVVWTTRHHRMPAPMEAPSTLDARTPPMHWTWSSDDGQWGRRALNAVDDPAGLAVTDDGTVWFAQQGRLSAWRDGRWERVDGPSLGFQAQLIADEDAIWVWSPYGEIRRLEDGVWTDHAVPGAIHDARVHDRTLFALQGDRLIRITPEGAQQAPFPDGSSPRHLVVEGGEVVALARDGERVEAPHPWTTVEGEVLASAPEIHGAWYIPGGRAWLTQEDDVLPVLWVDTGDGPRIRAELPYGEMAVDRWTGRAALLHRKWDEWRVSSLSLLDDGRPIPLPGVYSDVSDVKVQDDAVFVVHGAGITRIRQGTSEEVAPPGHTFVAADDAALITHQDQTLWRHPLDGGAPQSMATDVQAAVGDGVILAASRSGIQLFELDGSRGAELEPGEVWDVLGSAVHRGVCDGPRCSMTDVATGSFVGVLVVPDGMRFDPNISNGEEAMFWSRHTLMRQPYEDVTSP